MILHIGANRLINSDGLVAILDYETLTDTAEGRSRIAELEAGGRLCDIGGRRKKTIILMEDGSGWISPISSATLYKRLRDRIFDDTDEEQGLLQD